MKKLSLLLSLPLCSIIASPFIVLTSCNITHSNPVKWDRKANLGNIPSFKLVNNFSNNQFSCTMGWWGGPEHNDGTGGVMVCTDTVTVHEDFLLIGTSVLNLNEWTIGQDIPLADAVKAGLVGDIYLGFGLGGVDQELEFGYFHVEESFTKGSWTTVSEINNVKMEAIKASDNKTYQWNFGVESDDTIPANWWIAVILDEPIQNYFNIRLGEDIHNTITLTASKQVQFSVRGYLADADNGRDDGKFTSGDVYSTTASGESYQEYTRGDKDSDQIECMNIGAINSRTDLDTQTRNAFTPFQITKAKNFDVQQITGAPMDDDNDYFQEFIISTCTNDNHLYDQDGNIVGTTSYNSTNGNFSATYAKPLDTSVTSIYGFVNITDKRTPSGVMCKARLQFPVSAS
ncbi:MAG: hypothetical protein LBB39_00490 [Mycoplasmataceae bacterium]|nr:hypothetical protein [Mycoplasmataceae bacterium]